MVENVLVNCLLFIFSQSNPAMHYVFLSRIIQILKKF